jgi:YHS domain-containing protein
MNEAHQTVLFVPCILALAALSGCDRHCCDAPPAGTAAAAAPISTHAALAEPPQESAQTATQPLPAWEPVDAKFAGCARSCSAGPGVSRADARVQPGAAVGDLAYCPVSGVVFRVSGASSRRDVNGTSLYFCCESCASHFSAHRDEVLAQRGLSLPGG